MRFDIDIRGPQGMNPNEFGDPLTFSLTPRFGQSFSLTLQFQRMNPADSGDVAVLVIIKK